MGIFGKIKSVFNGFGKPYIKLEFDDNTALLAFQKRMNESGEAAELEYKNGEFAPMNGTAAEKLTHEDFFNILENNKEIYKYKDFNETNLLKEFGKPKQISDSYNNIKYAFEVKTPLKGVESKIYIWFDIKHALFDNSTKEDRSPYWTMIKPTLERPGIIFEKGKENYFIKCFETLNGIKIYFTFIPCLINEKRLKTFYVRTNKERKKKDLYNIYKDGGLLKYWEDVTAINGADRRENHILFVDCRLYCGKDENNFSNNQIFNEKNLGAPGDVYLVTDTRKNPRKELDETAAFKKIDIEKFNVNTLKALQDSDPLLYEEIKAGIGKTANPYLYNNLDILECRGMKPTYKILSDYSAFFETAKNNDTLRGFGLNDTKKLISDTCKKHYKDCAKIAAHLKADSKLQTAFNLWHWLHNNIKYEYDRDGREEIRTPLRTWADRERGVDCDCLSVFAWCVLRCLGYNPAFELAAFRNRPQFSHIYLNFDGIIIDRVWFIFNSRPPLITKTELFKIKEFNNLGNLF